jgi:hypothetical protein
VISRLRVPKQCLRSQQNHLGQIKQYVGIEEAAFNDLLHAIQPIAAVPFRHFSTVPERAPLPEARSAIHIAAPRSDPLVQSAVPAHSTPPKL